MTAKVMKNNIGKCENIFAFNKEDLLRDRLISTGLEI